MIAVISPSSDTIGLLYLVTIVCFILALRFLSSPKHARRGNWVGGVGMIIAIVSTLLLDGIGNWALLAIAALIGSAVGVVGARKVKMTAMPQMVALFNGVGGGAIALIAWSEFRERGGDLVAAHRRPRPAQHVQADDEHRERHDVEGADQITHQDPASRSRSHRASPWS